jgi:hypothetical protein
MNPETAQKAGNAMKVLIQRIAVLITRCHQ